MDDNDGDDDETDIFNTSRNDIFKIRQRARLNMVQNIQNKFTILTVENYLWIRW